MKKEYVSPLMEVVNTENLDIITESFTAEKLSGTKINALDNLETAIDNDGTIVLR